MAATAGLPPLLAVVTRLASTFRRWPTTYRWRGRVDLAAATSTGRWERTGAERGQGYRRATGSGEGRS